MLFRFQKIALSFGYEVDDIKISPNGQAGWLARWGRLAGGFEPVPYGFETEVKKQDTQPSSGISGNSDLPPISIDLTFYSFSSSSSDLEDPVRRNGLPCIDLLTVTHISDQTVAVFVGHHIQVLLRLFI